MTVPTRTPPQPDVPVLHRVVLIGSAVAAMGGALYALARERVPAEAAAPWRAPAEAGPTIRAEADAFRATAGLLAVAGGAPRRAEAHPRTLATYRLLRSYPGAPPRVPHGLTAEEFRTSGCNTCHERGGYSQRFGAYVPVTPHPEQEACLQCHAVAQRLVGVGYPSGGLNDACLQCHGSEPSRFREEGIDWVTFPFPSVGRRGDRVPVIPHLLDWRGNCAACHQGPGAVAEVRTSHPDQRNCRQCHLVPLESGEYVRPLPAALAPGGAR